LERDPGLQGISKSSGFARMLRYDSKFSDLGECWIFRVALKFFPVCFRLASMSRLYRVVQEFVIKD
jgi:hypothetical protein